MRHNLFELTTKRQNMFHSSLLLSTTKAVNRKEATGYSKGGGGWGREREKKKFLASLSS